MARLMTAAESAMARRLSDAELLSEANDLDAAYRRAFELDEQSEGGTARRLVNAARAVLRLATGPESAFSELQNAVDDMAEFFVDPDDELRRAALDDKGRP